MHVNINWIRKNFAILNKNFFRGMLPTPRFVVDCSSDYLGQCTSCGRSYEITLSNYYRRNEGDFLNTLLHEMIHLYFYSIGKLYVGHGSEFQQMGRSFDRYGFNIQTRNDACTNIHPNIYGNIYGQCLSKHIPTKLFNLMYRLTLLFVLWLFLSNRDAMKVIGFILKIVVTNTWRTICQLWTEYDMTNRIITLMQFLADNIVELINQMR